jgi:hypothetical protein
MNDVATQNKHKQAIEAAISALKSRGADVNPYSVADESQISRAVIVRNQELMDLIDEARHETNGKSGAAQAEEPAPTTQPAPQPARTPQSASGGFSANATMELIDRIDLLEEENKALKTKLTNLEQQSANPYAGLLEEENKSLQEHLARLKADYAALQVTVAQAQEHIQLLDRERVALESQCQNQQTLHQASLKKTEELFQRRISAFETENSTLVQQIKTLEASKGSASELEQAWQERLEAHEMINESLQERIAAMEIERQQAIAAAEQELHHRLIAFDNENKAAQEEIKAILAEREEADAFHIERITELEEENLKLNSLINQLKTELQSASKSVQIAYQQGLLAGKHDAQAEFDQQVQQMHDAVTANTANGGTVPPPPDSEPFVADVIPIDPESLNDPFTAKLLEALQAEVVMDENAAPIHTEYTAQEHADFREQTLTDFGSQIRNDEYSNSGSYTLPPEMQFTKDRISPEAAAEFSEAERATMFSGVPREHSSEAEDDKEQSSSFTAAELRDLIKNKEEKKDAPTTKTSANKRFVGGKRESSADPLPTAPRVFPQEIRRSCLLLGMKAEELTKANVLEAWKKEMAKPGVHPDTGGDTEMAIYLNTAKDTLLRWIEDQAPKLGKKFGASAGTREHGKTGERDKQQQ